MRLMKRVGWSIWSDEWSETLPDSKRDKRIISRNIGYHIGWKGYGRNLALCMLKHNVILDKTTKTKMTHK